MFGSCFRMLAVILGSVLFRHPCFLVFLRWWCLAVPWDRCKNCKQMIPFHSMFSGKPCVTSTAHWQRSVPEQHGHPHQHEPRVPTHGVATATTAALTKQVAPALLLFSFSVFAFIWEVFVGGYLGVLFGWPGFGGGGGENDCFRHDFKLFIGTQANCFRHDFKLFICLWHWMSVYSAPFDPPHPPPPFNYFILLWDGSWTPTPSLPLVVLASFV